MEATEGQDRVTRDEWGERFEAWKKSGLSMRAFCLREGIGLNGFRYWKGKLEAGARAGSMVKLPVRVGQVSPFLEVVVSGRFTIRVPAGFAGEELTRVLAVLERFR